MKALSPVWQRRGKIMLLTFEVFWIVVFVLNRVNSGAGGDIPQFVYVNF